MALMPSSHCVTAAITNGSVRWAGRWPPGYRVKSPVSSTLSARRHLLTGRENRKMTATAEERSTVSSLVDLSGMSLAEMATSAETLCAAIDRVIPQTFVAPVTVAAFNSAI
jgi:FXSXX-COOH protein